MTGKHHKWQLNWSRQPDGSVRHTSGLTFEIVDGGDGYSDLEATDASLDAFQTHELARGVPLHDLAARMQRLAREAGEWHMEHRQ